MKGYHQIKTQQDAAEFMQLARGFGYITSMSFWFNRMEKIKKKKMPDWESSVLKMEILCSDVKGQPTIELMFLGVKDYCIGNALSSTTCRVFVAPDSEESPGGVIWTDHNWKDSADSQKTDVWEYLTDIQGDQYVCAQQMHWKYTDPDELLGDVVLSGEK